MHKKDDYILQNIANHLIINCSFSKNIGLLYGTMGIIIFFYHYARYSKNRVYEEFAETLLNESVLNDPNISIFNLFIDSFVSNTYNSLQELFEQSDKEIEYFPTGTCLPFQKKMFLTVNGKILPCEKVGQEYPLGHVDSNSIHIDYKSISEIYSKLYSELIKSCEKCFTWHNCGQCVFVLKGQEKSMACNTICSANRAYKYLSTNITTAEKYPFIYKKLIDELVNK